MKKRIFLLAGFIVLVPSIGLVFLMAKEPIK